MISFPFDSEVTYEEDGTPIYDRGADSSILSRFFNLMFSNGVFATPTDGLLVTASSNEMSVVVRPGNCMLEGRMGIEADARTLVFEAAGTANDRIDTVVARLNINHDYRDIDLYVKKGAEANSPTAPALTRTGGIYELRLANVFIAKNTSIITAARITDTRTVDGDCGNVATTPDAYLYYKKTEIDTKLSTHKSSADHDGRYYTEAEVNALLGKYLPLTGGTISGYLKILCSYFDIHRSDIKTVYRFQIDGADILALYKSVDNGANWTFVVNFTAANGANKANYANSAGNADTVDGYHLSNIQTDAQNRADTAYNNAVNVANQKLPLTGGNVGNINVYHTDGTESQSSVQNSLRSGRWVASGSGNLGLFDEAQGQWIVISAGNSSSAVSARNNNQDMQVRGLIVYCKDVTGANYVDMHCNNVHYNGGLYHDSYRGVKENIKNPEEDRIRKILDIPLEVFDYRQGFGDSRKDVLGMIVDEVEDIVPESINYPENWDEENFNELFGNNDNPVPGIDDTKFIPYLIGMVQLQQKEIEALKQQMKELRGE